MSIKEWSSKVLNNIKGEGFFLYFSSRIISRVIKRLRYQFIGLLYGHRYYYDPVILSQLEYFCGEIAKQTAARKASLLNKEVKSLLEEVRNCWSNEAYVESLPLLDKARTLEPNHPDLPGLYELLSHYIYEEIGLYDGLCVKLQVVALEFKKSQYAESCFTLGSTKIMYPIWTGCIGHQGSLAQFIQAKQLGLLPKDNYVVLVNSPANNCYLSYLSSFQGFNIITGKDAKEFYNRACFIPFFEDLGIWELKNGYKDSYSSISIIGEKWKSEKRSPLLKIKDDHREKGINTLEELNIPADAWFVALHVRSGFAFRKNLRDGRNCEIDSYIPAIKAITDAGGYVFRMGDSSMKPLPEMPNVVDYAISPYKSDWMDVFLWACCRFFVGTNSGPNVIPPSFGVPQLWTNAAPFAPCSITFHNSLMLPKLWYSQTKQRLLTFSEILSCPAGWCERRTIGDDLVLVDNSAEELEAGVKEILELTKDGIQEHQYEIVRDPLNPLQVKLDAIREKYNVAGRLPVSRFFLDKYAHLIE